MTHIPFSVFNWANAEKIEHKGEAGTAIWQTIQFDNLRIRIVEYSKKYISDHWCKKGHIVHCLEGEFISELDNDEKFIITKGMTYVVSDELSTHRSLSTTGVKLLIIDGKFLSTH